MENTHIRARCRVRVLYLSRPSAAWPLHASTIPARGHRARVQESCSRRQSSRCASRRGTKPEATVSARRPSRRVMKYLDPRRAAIVRRYAAGLSDHNVNSDGYAQAELDLLCMGTHEHEARLSPAPLTTSHQATGRVHTERARRTLLLASGMMPVQWHALR